MIKLPTEGLFGLDVSHHQDPEAMDYKAAVSHGVSWVIARNAYGTKPDRHYRRHIEKAQGVGITTGDYTFFRQTQSPQEQLDVFNAQRASLGHLGPLPIFPVLDLEWNAAHGDGAINVKTFNKGAKFLCEALTNHYGGVIVYLSPGFFDTLRRPEWLLDYPWWIAHYTKGRPWCPFKPWSMWQFSGSAKIPDIFNKGPLDVNVARELPGV